MTIQAAPDNAPKSGRENLVLQFESSALETAGIRVTRAEFSRMMECSKQAVTDWVKSGRIVVGADGRFDPSRAVRTLLETGDPSKIRARVLAPLVAEMGQLRGRITFLEASLSDATENVAFHEGVTTELLDLIESLKFHIQLAWPQLIELPPEVSFAAISDWTSRALENGCGDAGCITDYVKVSSDCLDLTPCGDAWLDAEIADFLPSESYLQDSDGGSDEAHRGPRSNAEVGESPDD